jgi:hypothetical protein
VLFFLNCSEAIRHRIGGAFGENDFTRRRTSDRLSVTRFFVKKKTCERIFLWPGCFRITGTGEMLRKGKFGLVCHHGVGSRVGHDPKLGQRLPAEVD